jgi:hypothetical protein
MRDVSAGRLEEDRHHPSHALRHAVVAKGAEVHVLLEEDDLAHGLHLAGGAACSGTMKCAAFQGAA